MAPAVTLPALLDSLTSSLSSAIEATPKLAGLDAIENGVSLLDVKNELLLSYLQNLVFLILIKIRNAKSDDPDASKTSAGISDDVVTKLVELRLYLDKGVRPLEERLRFQLDKIIRAVDDAERSEKMAKEIQSARLGSESGSGSEEEDEEDEEDEDEDEDDGDDDEEEAGENGRNPSSKARSQSDAKQGPRFSNFAAPVSAGMAAAAAAQDKTGVYRAPRIAPVVMPAAERREQRRRPARSATVSEYIADELSAAPAALPSVGSNVAFGGRRVRTAAERDEELRRREFEESNFVRLPKDGRKQRAEKARAERRTAKMSFGGEEWRDLGDGVDRIARLTARADGGGGGRGTKALLEKSRKRGRDTIDGNRGTGMTGDTVEIGDRFNKKLKVLEGGRRDRGKR
ncbi:putative sas10 utp3 c1d family protein [Rosellinia necatrix]|uniref:Putative sas10 utp3 c1d family protein n=1 Tax=Rosellinia necatrix TaxID=77044 RepID=A0A1W2TE27_ROSNE|nr:putative sas10 utp3 c1d family protein [Rosellinia necatrix]